MQGPLGAEMQVENRESCLFAPIARRSRLKITYDDQSDVLYLEFTKERSATGFFARMKRRRCPCTRFQFFWLNS
jgi:hypothetical protein